MNASLPHGSDPGRAPTADSSVPRHVRPSSDVKPLSDVKPSSGLLKLALQLRLRRTLSRRLAGDVPMVQRQEVPRNPVVGPTLQGGETPRSDVGQQSVGPALRAKSR